MRRNRTWLITISVFLGVAVSGGGALAEGELQVAPPQQQPDVQVAPPQPQPDVQVAPPQQQPDVQVAPPQPQPDVQVAPPQPSPAPSTDLQPAAPAQQVQPAAQAQQVQPAAQAQQVQPAASAQDVQPAPSAQDVQETAGAPAQDGGSGGAVKRATALGDDVASDLNDARGALKHASRDRASRAGRALRSANSSREVRSKAARILPSAGRQARALGVAGTGAEGVGAVLDYRSQRKEGHSTADSAAYAGVKQVGGAVGAAAASALCAPADLVAAGAPAAFCFIAGDVGGSWAAGATYGLVRKIRSHRHSRTFVGPLL